jgi:hypothetical protein
VTQNCELGQAVEWAAASGQLVGRERRYIGELTLSDTPISISDEAAVAALLAAVRSAGLRFLPLPPSFQALRAREEWLRRAQTPPTEPRRPGPGREDDGGRTGRAGDAETPAEPRRRDPGDREQAVGVTDPETPRSAGKKRTRRQKEKRGMPESAAVLSMASEGTNDKASATGLLSPAEPAGFGRVAAEASLANQSDAAEYQYVEAAGKLPDLSDAALLACLETWLAAALRGVRTKADLKTLDWDHIAQGLLDPAQAAFVEEEAPGQWIITPGVSVPIDYSGTAPSVTVRLQDVTGVTEGPVVCHGTVHVAVHVMGPDGKRLCTACDLATFWQKHYPSLPKSLQQKYPRAGGQIL